MLNFALSIADFQMHGEDGGSAWWVVMVLLMVAFWVAVAAVVVALVRRPGDRSEPMEREEDPLTIAQRRLARGEITSDEFEQVRRLLDNSGASSR